MKWRYLWLVLCVPVAVGLLSVKSSGYLVSLVIWHATLIALPAAATILLGLRFGVIDQQLLGLAGLVCGGLFAYLNFWIWLASPSVGLLAAIVLILICLLIVAWLTVSLERATLYRVRALGGAGLLWVLYGLFLLAIGLAPFGLDHPLNSVAIRFSHQLPMDNQLPYIFAQQISTGQLKIPMIGDWLGSDRPPLQSAYFLASGYFLFLNNELSYQVQSTLLQALWVLGLWLVLCSFELSRSSMFVAIFAAIFSGFALVHGVFTWPKLLPVAYLGAITAVLFHPNKELLKSWRVGLFVGGGCALAMLSHGGSIFGLLGIGLAVLTYRRIPSIGFITSSVATGLILLGPWSFYQAFLDPPGDRLLKWHLAGVIPIDSRTLIQALRDSYSELTADQIISNKFGNFIVLLGNASDWAKLSLKVLLGLASDGEAASLRQSQFFNFSAALGLLLFSPLALLVAGARKTVQMAASLRLITISVFVILVWVVLLFGPGYTVIHQGSLMLMCFSVSGCTLALMSIRPIIGWGVTLLQFALVCMLYLLYIPAASEVSATNVYTSLASLALAAFIAIVLLLWKVCALNWQANYNNEC